MKGSSRFFMRQGILAWVVSVFLLTGSLWAQQPALRATTLEGPSTPDDQVTVPTLPPTLAEMVLARVTAYTKSDLPHGIFFEDLKGKSVLELNADEYYNPASVTKVMTTLAVLDRYGPQYRYTTRVAHTGLFDKDRNTITGDLVIESDGDPSFVHESIFYIGEQLRAAGIYTVEGNLLINTAFSLNLRKASPAAGNEFLTLLDRSRWTRVSQAAWEYYGRVRASGAAIKSVATEYEGIKFTSGKVFVDDGLARRTTLLEYQSAPLVKILKVMNAFSNNDMSHAVGRLVGGPAGVKEFLVRQVKLAPTDVNLETTSGLGNNSVTPRATVKILRYALDWCGKNRVAITDLLPIGGVDVGTLSERFREPELVGGIVAKTGTLNRVSALAGILYTRNRGPLVFAILERGAPPVLRKLQEEVVGLVAGDSGGTQAVAFGTEMGPSLIEEARIRVPSDRTRN